MSENITPSKDEIIEEKDKVITEASENKEEAKEDKKASSKKRGRKKDESEMTEEEKKKAGTKKKDKPKDAKSSARRLISYITKQRFWLVIVAILVVLSTIVTVASSLIMQPVYTAIEDVVVRGGDPDTAFAKIVKALVLMSVAYAISAVMSYSYTRIMLSVSIRVLTNMRRELFNHMQYLPIGYFDKRKTGQIMSHFTSDIGRINSLVQSTFTSLISSVIQAVMTITIMVVYSWQITLTITVSIMLMFLTVFVITSICRPLFKKQQEATAECNGYIEEYTRGIKIVKIFCREETAKKEFAERNEVYRKTGVKANIIGGFMSPIMSMITRVNYAVAVSLGATFVIKGKMDVPKLITYLQYVSGYASPIAAITSSYSTLISALAGAERVFEVLDTPHETDEGKITLAKKISEVCGLDEEEGNELCWRVPEEDGTYKLVPVKCDIEVKDVTFSYEEGKPVLKNISTHASSGEKLAFVGSTGAGKTTITNLINRFYEIEEGEITIDGINIKDIKKEDLRSSMAFVLQDTKLFVGTIADNIRYGKLDATDEEIIEAARISGAHSFIEKLPDGYETEIRADGVNISAGQAQLINIARAAIAGRPLLVLDEATSSVDTRTERLIEIGMDKVMDDKTVLVIAHRLSTVRNSEEIVVLENGEIIENGNHENLIEKGGKYYELYTGAYEMT